MKKSAALLALVSFLVVPVGISFAGTTTTSTSSSRSSSPSSPAPAARTATTSFGSFGSAPKPAAAPAPASKPAPIAAAPQSKPAAEPAPVQKSTSFGTAGNAPVGKPADSTPSRSASAMSADLTKSAQQKSAIDSWDNRNRVANTAPTDVNRDHVLPDSGKRWDSPPTAAPSQGDRSLASAREQAYRERQQARQDQMRAEELRIERLREERRLELARQQSSHDSNLVNGVIIGSMLNHNQPTVVVQQPAAPYQQTPAQSADRPLQRYETSGPTQGESSGSGFFWFFVILLAASAFGGAYWFLNRKPAPADSGPEPVRRKSNYDLK